MQQADTSVWPVGATSIGRRRTAAAAAVHGRHWRQVLCQAALPHLGLSTRSGFLGVVWVSCYFLDKCAVMRVLLLRWHG